MTGVMRAVLERTACVTAAAMVVLAGVGPDGARGQSAEPWDDALASTLTGSWALVGSRDTAQATIEVSIAAAVLGLPPLIDTFAASELRARLIVSPTLVLSVTSSRIEARFLQATYDSAPGAPARYLVPDGTSETMEVVQLLRDGRLEQIFTTDGGRRWNTFTPSPDGERLAHEVVLRARRLSRDVRYAVTYHRIR